MEFVSITRMPLERIMDESSLAMDELDKGYFWQSRKNVFPTTACKTQAMELEQSQNESG